MRSIILTFSLLVTLFSASAQSFTHGTAGAAGIGSGFTGLSRNDAGSLLANPAGLAGLSSFTALLLAENRFASSEIRSFSAAAALPLGHNSFGLRLQYFGHEAYNEQQISLQYGRLLSEKIHLGLALWSWQKKIPEYGSRMLFSVDIGLQAELLPGLWAAALISNPVRQDVTDNEVLPSVLSAGIGYQPAKQLLVQLEVEKDIDYPARLKAGIDYELSGLISLRAGVITAPNQFTLGLGIQALPQLRIDLAASRHNWLGYSPAIGIVYSGERSSTTPPVSSADQPDFF